MNIEARKYKLISQITRIEDDTALKALEETIEQLLQMPGKSAPVPTLQHTMAEYRGILSKDTADALLEHVAHSREEWELNI